MFPATGYLVLAWKALAKLEGKVYDKMPVCIEDVHIQRATILSSTGMSELSMVRSYHFGL